jgi:hypothetical protein
VITLRRSKIFYFDLLLAIAFSFYQLYVNRGRLLGNDYNWDLLNYHLTNVTLKQDLALHVSTIQSYFPSMLDRLILPIHTSIPSPFSGLIMLTPFVFNYIILRKLYIRRLFNDSLHLPNTLAVVSLSTAMAISQLNNSMGDIILSPLVLAGSAMFLIGIKESNSNLLIFSALPIAIAFSLKWTFLYVQISIFLIFIFLVTSKVIKFATLLKWGLINVGIFALISLHDIAMLFKETGNPVFPFANKFFKAESYPEINFRDNRFGFRTFSDFFATPFKLAVGDEASTSELLFQDFRFLIMFGALILWVVSSLFLIVSRQRSKFDVVDYLGLFVFLAYVLWGYLFGISRYFLTIEFLVLILALGILSKFSNAVVKNRFIGISITLGLVMILNSSTSSVNWGYDPVRTSNIAFEKEIYPVKTAPESALLIADTPLAFISYQISTQSDIIYLSPSFNEYNLQDQLRLIDNRVIYSLSYNKDINFLNSILLQYKVQSTSKCQTIELNFNNGLTPSTVFLCETKSL